MADITTAVATAVQELRESYASRITHSKQWRVAQLEGLKTMLIKEESRIYDALQKDLRKPLQEAYAGEYSTTMSEIKEAISQLSVWMSPVSVATPMFNVKGLSSSTITYQPLGVVLIISPWNYPVNLLISPLVGAIAAGNCVLIKPSEVAAATSALIADILPKYVDNKCIKVIEGGVTETTEILKHKFNHIFYTGNGAVAKVIMRAAAEYLCPVTLELGGKNPCFVDTDVDLDVTAKRIVWGRTFNCGQTCLAVDLVFVQKGFQDTLIKALVKHAKEFFGENPQKSESYPRIINQRHVQRITNLMKEVPEGNIVLGGPKEVNEDDLFIPFTILKDMPLNTDLKIMQEEIFGPVLPIVPVDNVNQAIDFVNSQPHPLALYVFSRNSRFKDLVLSSTTSGGAVCNDVLVQFAQSSLPFGGVGESGMGSYHGKKSFTTFSHERPVLDKTTYFDMGARYPPYSSSTLKTIKYFM